MQPTTIFTLLALAATGLSAPTDAVVVARTSTSTTPSDFCKTTNQDAYCCDKPAGSGGLLDPLLGLLDLDLDCLLSLGSSCGTSSNVYCCNAGQSTANGIIALNVLTGCSPVNLNLLG